MIHHESVSRRGVTYLSKKEYESYANMLKKYGNKLYHDKFFNHNLSLTNSDVVISEIPRAPKLWRDFIEVIVPFDIGDILITLIVCINIAKKYSKK